MILLSLLDDTDTHSTLTDTRLRSAMFTQLWPQTIIVRVSPTY